MATTYNLTFTCLPLELDPADYLEYETIDDLDQAIEEALLETSGIDYDLLEGWTADPDFYAEWARLKEEERQGRQEEYDDDN